MLDMIYYFFMRTANGLNEHGKHINIFGYVNLQHLNLIHLPINAVVQCITGHSRSNVNDRHLIFVKILLLREGNEKVLPLVVHGIIKCDLVTGKKASSVLVFGKPSALSYYRVLAFLTTTESKANTVCFNLQIVADHTRFDKVNCLFVNF